MIIFQDVGPLLDRRCKPCCFDDENCTTKSSLKEYSNNRPVFQEETVSLPFSSKWEEDQDDTEESAESQDILSVMARKLKMFWNSQRPRSSFAFAWQIARGQVDSHTTAKIVFTGWKKIRLQLKQEKVLEALPEEILQEKISRKAAAITAALTFSDAHENVLVNTCLMGWSHETKETKRKRFSARMRMPGFRSRSSFRVVY